VIPRLDAIARGDARRAIGHGQGEKPMAIKFRVAVEIEGASPGTFKMEFEFSDEKMSDFTLITICHKMSLKSLEPSP